MTCSTEPHATLHHHGEVDVDDAISLAQVPEAQVSHMNRWLRLPGHLLHPPTPHNNGLSGLSVGRRVKKENADPVHRLLCKYAGTTQTWNAMQNSFPQCARKAEVKGFPQCARKTEVKGFPQKATCLGGEKARGPGSTAVQGRQLSDGLGTWKEQDWRLKDKKVWGRGLWMNFSE